MFTPVKQIISVFSVLLLASCSAPQMTSQETSHLIPMSTIVQKSYEDYSRHAFVEKRLYSETQ